MSLVALNLTHFVYVSVKYRANFCINYTIYFDLLNGCCQTVAMGALNTVALDIASSAKLLLSKFIFYSMIDQIILFH